MAEVIHGSAPSLVQTATKQVVQRGDYIRDAAGRLWFFEYVIPSVGDRGAYVGARRINDRKVAARTSEFGLSMFPSYRVSVCGG